MDVRRTSATGGFVTTVGADASDDAAAAPTGFPQSMQMRDSGVFERPQNAQTVKLGLQGIPP